MLPSDQGQIIQQAKFAYSPLEKVFERKKRTTEEHGHKQIETIKNWGKK